MSENTGLEIKTENAQSEAAQTETLSQEDKMVLELAKMNKKLAIASSENAELHYKYVVLQVYMKYGLTSNDSIDEYGVINRNVSTMVNGK